MIEAMCFYKKLNPDKDVTLSEKSAKDVMNFFNREGKQYGPMLNAIAESGLSMEELINKSNETKNNENDINEIEVDDDSE
jgi:hypothetical protein